MDKVYVAWVTTESCDHYNWVYDYKPTVKEVIQRVWEEEGECEDLDWYEGTTAVHITQEEVKTR